VLAHQIASGALSFCYLSGKTPHDIMYQFGILQRLRRLSKIQEQIIRKIQVGVRPASHSRGSFCHPHAVVLKRQDNLLHVNPRSFLKAHANKVHSRLHLNMPFACCLPFCKWYDCFCTLFIPGQLINLA